MTPVEEANSAVLEKVNHELSKIVDDGSLKSVIELGWIKNVRVFMPRSIITMALPNYAFSQRDRIAKEVKDTLLNFIDIKDVQIEIENNPLLTNNDQNPLTQLPSVKSIKNIKLNDDKIKLSKNEEFTAVEPLTYAYLETTNHCNLDCVFCNRREVVTQKTLRHMTLENWDRILNILSPHPINEAKLMGLGEPFFHPNYDQITLRFKETFPGAFVISATNLQYKVSDKFFNAAKNLDLLYLSIDGYKDTYEAARPGAKWSRLIASLEEIQKRINLFKLKTRFEINFVATPDTIHSLENVYKLYETYDFITDIRVNLAQWWGENDKLELDYEDEYLSILRKYKSKVKGKAPWDFKDCFWPKRGIYMTVDGSVKVCCINTSTSPIGNIFLDDLEEMRRKSKLKKIRDDLINNFQENPHCKTCSYKVLSPVLDKIIN